MAENIVIAGACRTPQVKEMLTKAWYGLKAHTVGARTFSFLWGKGPSNDKKSYSVTPSSGIPYICPLAGPEYIKRWGYKTDANGTVPYRP